MAIAWIEILLAEEGMYFDIGEPEWARGRWVIRKTYNSLADGRDLGSDPRDYIQEFFG